jgi:hypothetical protein
MGMRMSALLTVLLCALSASAQNKSHHDGNWLFKMCAHARDEHPPQDAWYNLGYCDGYIEGHAERSEIGRVCFREGMTNDQVQRVVIKYLNDSPEQLDFPAPLLISHALEKAFPCSKESSATMLTGAHLLPRYQSMFEEAEKLGKSLGYPESEVIEAFDEMPEKTVEFLRNQSAKKVQ